MTLRGDSTWRGILCDISSATLPQALRLRRRVLPRRPMPDLRLPSRPVADQPEAERARALLERLRRGDEAALAALLEMYWDRLLAYAARILGSPDAAEDMVQETFVRLWKGRRGMAGSANLQAFLYATTRNLCLNEERRRRIRSRFSIRTMIPRPGAAADPLDSAQAGELETAARRAVEALPARRREIFQLAREHGLTYREIADVLHLSPQTVANQMSAALDQLRSGLSDYMDR